MADHDSRIEVRISSELRSRVEAEADRRGQSLAVFVRRALEAALAEGTKDLPSVEAQVKTALAASPRAPERTITEVVEPAKAEAKWAKPFRPMPKGGK